MAAVEPAAPQTRPDSLPAAAPASALAAAPPEIPTLGGQEPPAIVAPSETTRRVQAIVQQLTDTVVRMDAKSLFGLVAAAGMLVFYSLSNRSPFFILGFAMACWMGSAYAFLQWPWPFGLLAGLGGFVGLWKWSREIESRSGKGGKAGHLLAVWPMRLLYVLASICGIILLIVDLPTSAHLLVPISRAAVEAAPLLLVGIAFLTWLAIDRPAPLDLIKQAAIAAAFILWGVDLLMPPGRWATFVGAVVIAIYVFDLAWLMEGHLRKKAGFHGVAGSNGNSPGSRGAK